VKRAVGRKTNPVDYASSDDDFTSDSSSSFSCNNDFSLKIAAEVATVFVSRSAEDLRRNPSLFLFDADSGKSTRAGWERMVNGRLQAATFSLWLESKKSRNSRRRPRAISKMIRNLYSCVRHKQFRLDFGITTDQQRCTFLTSPLPRTRLNYWRENETWLVFLRTFGYRRP
jgi:hypothetical protein